MKQTKPVYDDDDGRIIADMTDLTRQNLFLPRMPRRISAAAETPRTDEAEHPWMDNGFSRKERFWYTMGALKAAAFIALAFILGLGLVIAALLLLW